MHLRGFVLATDRLTGVDRFLRRKGLLCEVQVFLLVIAERQFPGLEQEARLPIRQHLVGRYNRLENSKFKNLLSKLNIRYNILFIIIYIFSN